MIATCLQEQYLDRIGLGTLLLLAFALPFELKDPLFRLGPLEITSVELLLYLVICVWGMGRLAGRRGDWIPAHTAVAIYGAMLISSALLAQTDRDASLKFALRTLGGCALFFSTTDIVRNSKSTARLCTALIAGGLVSAGTAFLEISSPGAATFLMRFKTAPSLIGSYLRAGGTFQYANIASMYWEAILPLALTIPAWRYSRQTGRRIIWAWVLTAVILIEAILLSTSRAGIGIAILILVALAWQAAPLQKNLRTAALLSLFSMTVLIVIHSAVGPLLVLRLTTRDVSSWYRVQFLDSAPSLTIKAREMVKVPLTIRNTGRMTWRAHGREEVVVSYHWLDPAGQKILIWQGARSELPSDLEPGSTIRAQPWVIAPAEPGNYTLQWDMVQEQIAWFSVFYPTTVQMNVRVLPSETPIAIPNPPPSVNLPLPTAPSRWELWNAAAQMWLHKPLVGMGSDAFRHHYGSYLGLTQFDDRIYANNMYLELLANQGVLGLFSFITIPITLALSMRGAWRLQEDARSRLLILGIGVALAAFYLHGLVDYFLPFTPTYGLFWMLAGMAARLGSRP